MASISSNRNQASGTQEIILHPPKFGVVTFQNASDPTSGAACVSSRAPQYFNRRNELASDVIWVSNANNSTQAQNFRASNFLRSSPMLIASDLGVSMQDTVDGLPRVADTVSMVRDIAAQVYPWNDFATDWSHESLPTCIARILPSTGETLGAMESPLRQAYQSYSSVPDRTYPDGTAQVIYTLRVNRLRYSQYICSTQIPDNSWISIPEVNRHNLTMDDFLDPDRPSLVEASVEFSMGLNEFVTPALTAFGSAQAMGRSTIRKWIAQPELAWLVEHANVHITSAFLSQGGGRSLSPAHALPPMLTADPVFALSIATGIVAECHWAAISAKTSERRIGQSATARYVDIASPSAVWLRAVDRAYCFAMAKLVAERGFLVRGYGYGSVSFFGPKNDIGSIMDLAEELGTCHPCLAAVQKRMLLGQDGNSFEIGL